MKWLKFTHLEGDELINLSKVFRIKQTSEKKITVYDSNSIVPLTFEFETEDAAKNFFYKLTQILDTIDLDSFSIEYFTRY
jgi:hypothetical protein